MHRKYMSILIILLILSLSYYFSNRIIIGLSNDTSVESPLGSYIKIFPQCEIALIRDKDNELRIIETSFPSLLNGAKMYEAPDNKLDWVDIVSADIDHDWKDEIIALKRYPNNYYIIQCFEPEAGSTLYENKISDWIESYFVSWAKHHGHVFGTTNINYIGIAAGDLNGDHGIDIIVLGIGGGNSIIDWYYHYFNGSEVPYDPKNLWFEIFNGLVFKDIAMGDINSDGLSEVILISNDIILGLKYPLKPYVLNSIFNIDIKSTFNIEEVVKIALGDIDGDFNQEIFILCKSSNNSYYIKILDYNLDTDSLVLIKTIQLDEKYGDLCANDIDADGKCELALIEIGDKYSNKIIILDFTLSSNNPIEVSGVSQSIIDVTQYGYSNEDWNAIAMGDFDNKNSVYAEYIEHHKAGIRSLVAVLFEPPYESGINYASSWWTSSKEIARGKTFSFSIGASAFIGIKAGAEIGGELLGIGGEVSITGGIGLGFSLAFEKTNTRIRATCESMTFKTDGDDILVFSGTEYDVYVYKIIGPLPNNDYWDNKDAIIPIFIPSKVKLWYIPYSKAINDPDYSTYLSLFKKPGFNGYARINGKISTYPRNNIPSTISGDSRFELLYLKNEPIHVTYGGSTSWEFSESDTYERGETFSCEISLTRSLEIEATGGAIGKAKIGLSAENTFSLGAAETHTFSITITNAFGSEHTSIPREYSPNYDYYYVPYLYRISTNEYSFFVLDYYVMDTYNHPLGSGYKYGLNIEAKNSIHQNVNPGFNATYLINIKNMGCKSNKVKVNVNGIPSGWQYSLSNSNPTIPPYSNYPITLKINVPLNAIGDTSHTITVNATSTYSAQCTSSIQLSLYVNKVSKLELTANSTQSIVHINETAYYKILVTNYGNTKENILLACSDAIEGWKVKLKDTLITLNPNETKSTILEVTPIDVNIGDELIVIVQCSVQNPPPYAFDLISIRTIVSAIYDVKLISFQDVYFIYPGESLTIPIEIINNGTSMDIYDISIENLPTNWIASLTKTSIYLNPGESETLNLIIQPNLDAKCYTYPLIISARSRNSPNTYSEIKLNIVVTRSDVEVSIYKWLKIGNTTINCYDFEVGDINGDNNFEVILLQSNRRSLAIYSLNEMKFKFNRTFNLIINLIDVIDLNDDGKDEIIISKSSEIIILNSSIHEISKINVQEQILKIAFGDINDDHRNDLILITRHNNTNYIKLYTYNNGFTQIGAINFSLYELKEIRGLTVNNGDIVVSYCNMTSFNGYYATERIMYLKYNGSLRISLMRIIGRYLCKVKIVHVGGIFYPHFIIIPIIYPTTNSKIVYYLASNDLDDDGIEELISFTNLYTRNGISYLIEIHRDNTIEFYPLNINSQNITGIAFSDIDNDNVNEVMFSSIDGRIGILSIKARSLWTSEHYSKYLMNIECLNNNFLIISNNGLLLSAKLSAKYGVSIKSSNRNFAGYPGNPIVIPLTITNIGMRTDSFDIYILNAPPSWITTLNRYSVSLYSGYSTTIYLTIYPPANSIADIKEYFYVYAVSQHQPSKTSSILLSIKLLDNIPPTAPSNLEVLDMGTGNQLMIRWSPSIDNGKIKYYQIYRNNTLIGYSTNNEYIDSSLNASNKYVYYVRAVDSAGNISPKSISVAGIPMDITPPKINIKVEPEISSGNVSILVSSSEPLIGSPIIYIKKPNGLIDYLNLVQIDDLNWRVNYSSNIEGLHIIGVNATDINENTFASSNIASFKIIRTPPEISLIIWNMTNPAINPWRWGSIEVILHGEFDLQPNPYDPNSTIPNVNLTIIYPSGEIVNMTILEWINNYGHCHLQFNEDGEYIIELNALDRIGNLKTIKTYACIYELNLIEAEETCIQTNDTVISFLAPSGISRCAIYESIGKPKYNLAIINDSNKYYNLGRKRGFIITIPPDNMYYDWIPIDISECITFISILINRNDLPPHIRGLSLTELENKLLFSFLNKSINGESMTIEFKYEILPATYMHDEFENTIIIDAHQPFLPSIEELIFDIVIHDQYPPQAPILIRPQNISVVFVNPVLSWSEVNYDIANNSESIKYYQVQISINPNFTDYVLTFNTSNTFIVAPIGAGYWYWRVRAIDYFNQISNFSDIWSFNVTGILPPIYQVIVSSPKIEYASPGEEKPLLFKIFNLGNIHNEYQIELNVSGNYQVSLNTTKIELGPWGSSIISINILIPEITVHGERINITLNAYSKLNPNINDSSTTALIIGGPIYEYKLKLKAGWNLVSVPLRLLNNSIANIFGNNLYYVAYIWNPILKRYEIAENFEVGKAYWILVNEDVNITLIGEVIEELNLTLNKGWNMIGSIFGSKAYIEVFPSNSIYGKVYLWNNINHKYEISNLIPSGAGCWILAYDTCNIKLMPCPPSKP